MTIGTLAHGMQTGLVMVTLLTLFCRPTSIPAGRQGGDIVLSALLLHRMPSGMVQAQPQQSHMPTLQSEQTGPVLGTSWLAAMQSAVL
jgi:hypothetical protein